MNHGPLIFLGVFAALALSWFGLVFEPQLQLGNAEQATNLVNTAELYPQMRPGMARQGMHKRQLMRSRRLFESTPRKNTPQIGRARRAT